MRSSEDILGSLHELACQYRNETPEADNLKEKRLYGLSFRNFSPRLSGLVAFGLSGGMENVAKETAEEKGGEPATKHPSRACPQLPNFILLEDSYSQVSIQSN